MSKRKRFKERNKVTTSLSNSDKMENLISLELQSILYTQEEKTKLFEMNKGMFPPDYRTRMIEGLYVTFFIEKEFSDNEWFLFLVQQTELTDFLGKRINEMLLRFKKRDGINLVFDVIPEEISEVVVGIILTDVPLFYKH